MKPSFFHTLPQLVKRCCVHHSLRFYSSMLASKFRTFKPGEDKEDGFFFYDPKKHEQKIKNDSSMFGSKFLDFNSAKDIVEDPQEHGKIKILHLNAAHAESSLVAVGARELFAQLSFKHSVTEIDIYRDIDIPYSQEHSLAKLNILQGKGTNRDVELFLPVLSAARLLNSMDMVVISTPMWNFGPPHLLKRYIDIVVQPGVTFEDQGMTPIPGLSGRRLVIFSSAGANDPLDNLNPMLQKVFGMMGFDVQETVFIRGSKGLSTFQGLSEWTVKEAQKIASNINRDYDPS